MKPDARFELRISVELLAKVKEKALAESVSTSEWIRTAIAQHVDGAVAKPVTGPVKLPTKSQLKARVANKEPEVPVSRKYAKWQRKSEPVRNPEDPDYIWDFEDEDWVKED